MWESGEADLLIGNVVIGEIEAIEHADLPMRFGARGLLEDRRGRSAMSVEVGVVCPVAPDAEQVARLVGPLMSVVLHRRVIHALVDHDHGRWTLQPSAPGRNPLPGRVPASSLTLSDSDSPSAGGHDSQNPR